MTEKENIKEENLKESEINEEIKSDETAQTPVDEAKTQEDEAANDNNEEEKRDPLTVALEEIENLKDKYLRSVAEFDNYRKRTLKEKAELILNGSDKAVQAFLPIIDAMDRAIHSAETTDDIETVKEGMKLICQKTFKVMESLGVKKIDTADADFNTDFHEAVAMVPGMGDDKKGKILDCVQAGYTLNDKVIRHAKVAVGQ